MAERKPLFLYIDAGEAFPDEIATTDSITLGALSVGGDITVTGSVDGRDLSVDGAVLDKLDAMRQDRDEPNGFVNRTDSELTFTEGTRTFSIAPATTSFDFYVDGVKYTKSSAQEVVISDVEGNHYIYFDDAGTIQETTTWSSLIITKYAFIAQVYWNAADDKEIFVQDERHGIVMDSSTHLYLHQTVGSRFVSGLGLSGFVVDGDGSLNTHAQFLVGDGSIRDEDIIHTITDGTPQELDPSANIPILFRQGASGLWKKRDENSYPVIYGSDGSGYTGTRLPYNQWTGATWQLTELSANGYFVLVHYFATGDINHPIVAIQGQAEYTTLGAAHTGATTELNSLIVDGLPMAEWVAIATVIFTTDSNFTNATKAAIVSTATSDNYIDWRTATVTPSGGISTSDHGNLSGLSDDDHPQYLLIDGTRAMTGDLQMGNNQITGLSGGDADNEALAYGQSGANLAGLTIDTSALVMSNQKITGLGAATADNDAIAYGQSGANLAGLSIDTNPLTMGTQKITGLGSATTDGDALAYGQSGANFAGLTIDTSALNMSNQQITNLAAPTLDGDAANKYYVDTLVAKGVHWREPVLHASQLNNAEGVLAAAAFTIQSNPVDDDNVVLTDGTTTRTYYFGTGTGDVQVTIGATVADTMTNLAAAITGDGSGAWTAVFTTDLDAIDVDGVVVIWEDDNDGGVSKIYGTWATQANAEIVDFTGLFDYTKKTRSTLLTSAPTESNFGFRRTQASLTDGDTHQAHENDVIYAWDAGSSTWGALSSAGSIPDATSASGGGTKGKITADEDFGLEINSGILKIDLATTNPGLEFSAGDLTAKVDTTAGMELTAGGIAIDLAASNPGLQFSGGDLAVLADTTQGLDVGASGIFVDLASNPGLEFSGGDLTAKVNTAAGLSLDVNGINVVLDATNPALEFNAGAVRVKVDGAHGIIRGTTGLEIEIDDTPDTLDVDADGLKVVGLPLQFKVNNVSTTANVTAANLNELTGGGVTALHSHNAAVEASRVENDLAVDEAIAAGEPVYFTSTGNRVGQAEAGTQIKARVIGVARTAQGTVGQTCPVVSNGPCAGILSGATPGDRYYLDATGGLIVGVPTGNNRIVAIGYAINSTDLWVEIQDLGRANIPA